ncbi:MAG: TonB-dependent receptor [Candidatus Eremiobacteraeota bacterium]|nr:TonB-dependent receptor [Candidatus Eremiobacteraeota bacterium]
MAPVRLFLVIALAILCVGRAQAAAGGLRASVVDGGGHPIAGAAVSARGPRDYFGSTDAGGTLTIADAAAGTYLVSVTKAGYQAASQSGVVVTADNVTVVSLVMLPATLQTIALVRSTAGGPHFNTTSASVNVVTSQSFADQAQYQVTQVLNQIPGVQISLPGGSTNGAAPGSVTVPNIRGAASYETASLIDGHPLAVSSYGDYITSYLSSFMFGSVEVVKGPGSSALEVNNAINGTVNFRTKDPTATAVPEYEAGYTTNGGTYANLGLTASTLDGRLGYAFDVSVVNDPSAANGKQVLIDPSGGHVGGSFGKPLAGSATYANVANTESNIQTGYSLLACCYTLLGDFYNTSQLLKLRYQISPSTVATVSYLDGQTFTDQNDNVGNITNAQFRPGSGYSGSLRPGAQQVMYLFAGAPNNLVNVEPIFQAEVSSAIGNDTILARYYHASLYRETQQGTGPGILDPYRLTLYGSSANFSQPFNGLTTPVAFQDYFQESELDKLGGWSFQYRHPFGENSISFSADQNTTQATSYENSTFTNVFIPQGSSQLFTTLQLHANLALSPTVSAMLADYQNVYRSTYATNCPFSFGFSNCATDGSNVTFATSTIGHNDPRVGFVWQPHPNLAVRLAAGSAIAPPYLNLLGQITAPSALWDTQTNIATLTKNSGQLRPETAFGYDLGADYRWHDGWTVLSGDVYENNLYNHYFGETLFSGLFCGQVSYPCLDQGGHKAPPTVPIYYSLNTNISNFRFEGIELSLQRTPPVGWGFNLSGSLLRGYVYNLPPYFYCSTPGPRCQYNQNLNIIANQNLNGEGIGSVSYSPFFGFGSTIGSLNTRIPYAQGNAAVSYTFKNRAFVMLGTTYYGNNNSLNEPPFGYGYFTVRYPFTPMLSLQISGNNIWNAWPGVVPIYGSGVAIPLANGGTAATLGNVLGPATWTFLLTDR